MRKSVRLLAVISVCLMAPAEDVAAAAEAAAAERSGPVTVTGGEVAGARLDGVDVYLGVPFAAPPVGHLRWRPPQPVLPWKGIKDARSFAPACSQTVEWVPNPKSEDCLFLNIWAPEKVSKAPVIFWIHGGGYFAGTGAQPGTDGSNLAKRGAVVVTINYRLGVFGFFSHPELAAESPVHASGNQGILDQIAALQWVRDNIAAFGGDPQRVTIMGESAGGMSVALLVASPLAKGLFHRAVSESGNDGLPMNASEQHRFQTRSSAEAKGLAFANAAGAAGLADLRKMSVADLQHQTWSPVTYIDGHLLREDLTTTYRQHRQNDVPLLAGWNAEEVRDLAPEILATSDFTAARHRALTEKLLGYVPSQRLLAAYPGATDGQAKTSINQLTTDWWGWRIVHWAQLQARYGKSKPYVYFFAHHPTEPETACGYGCGAGHGAEIQYLFDNLDAQSRNWSAADQQLATRLADTLVNFARTGSPTGKGLPAWPAFDGAPATILRIGGPTDLKRHPLPDFTLFPSLPD